MLRCIAAASLTALMLIFYSGCASRLSEQSVSPFALIGAEGDVYIFAPVKGNERLLTTLFASFVPEKTAAQYLNRTTEVYAGISYGMEPSLCIVSNGSYPTGLAGLLFSQKNGWDRRTDNNGKIVYYHSETADVVLPSSKTAAVLLGSPLRNTGGFLERFNVPEQPVFSSRFETFTTAGLHGIGIYIRSGKTFIADVLRLKDIELPLTSIELYLEKTGDSYRYSAVFETPNERTAVLLRMMIKSILNGECSVQGSAVFLENADITEDRLAALLPSILF